MAPSASECDGTASAARNKRLGCLLPWLRARPLMRDVLRLLLVKLVLLAILRMLFFAHPAAQHMRLPSDVVARNLLGTSSTHSSVEGASHD